MTEYFSAEALSAFFQVIMIDLVLAGDNAIVIGLAAAGLPKEQRSKAILIGIGAATLLRIVFALTTTQLLLLGPGLLIGGGLLLLWVCWKMWRELRVSASAHAAAEEALAHQDLDGSGGIADSAPRKTFAQAAWQIVIADVSMSLDNVLAVAGAALEHPIVLVFGLVLSIALMGIAATFIARLLHRHRWIAYLGLVIILYVAVMMVWDGAHDYFGAAEVTELTLRFLIPGWLSGISNVDLLAGLGAGETAAAEELRGLRSLTRHAELETG
jgi:YjbE family integral membrane protein